MKTRKLLNYYLIFAFISTWLAWDLSQAESRLIHLYDSFRYESEYDAISSATTKVAIVRSNDANLAHPKPVNDKTINYQTIEEMTRRAIELSGGLYFIKSGDMVLLKPNIVDPEPAGSGEVTDVRVVKAVIKIIDEIDHGKIELVVAEGAPRPMNYEMEYATSYSAPKWDKIWDAAGYQELLTDTSLSGVNLRFSNLNCTMPADGWKPEDGWPADSAWRDMVLMDVAGGGEASPQGGQYYVHQDIINADVFITIPVMKVHSPGVTVALKNQIGIVPSAVYGYSKNSGVPQNGYAYQLTHTKEPPQNWIDKEIVDVCNIAKIKLAVVDAIACLEKQKTAIRSGGVITNLVRMNTIIAGTDPVAIDHVCTRIMGMNPDDIEHITLGEKVGLGTNDPDNINIVGAALEDIMTKFIKSSVYWGDFGQSNRTWLLSPAYSISGITDPINHEFISAEADLAPKANEDNWSDAVYFTDDRMDLENYYQMSSSDDRVSYAFAYFDAPKDQQAELWIGSDEALKIYINGKVVYQYSGTRSFKDDKLVIDKHLVNIKAGENRLLVKSLQKYSRYDFSLNICEPESDANFDGNRIWNLKFKTVPDSTYTGIDELNNTVVSEFKMIACPNPFNPATAISFSLPRAGKINLSIYNSLGQLVEVLEEKNMNAGHYAYTFNGSRLSSGVYFYQIIIDNRFRQSKKMILVK